MDGGAFGAGKSTGKFEPLVFIRKPEVILRAVSLVTKIFDSFRYKVDFMYSKIL